MTRATYPTAGARYSADSVELLANAMLQLETMRGTVAYNYLSRCWTAHAPDGGRIPATRHISSAPSLLIASAYDVVSAIDAVYTQWVEAGRPQWPEVQR